MEATIEKTITLRLSESEARAILNVLEDDEWLEFQLVDKFVDLLKTVLGEVPAPEKRSKRGKHSAPKARAAHGNTDLCPECGKSFQVRGLNVHRSRAHGVKIA